MSRPRRNLTLWLALAAIIGGACTDAEQGRPEVAQLPPTPAEHSRGETLYDANCASCHGPKGMGTTQGPPLVHVIYEPGHHSDASFHVATQRGVFAHHWRFGNMPPQPQVAQEDVAAIIGYVRWLQRQAGIE
jgi:cytochrome c